MDNKEYIAELNKLRGSEMKMSLAYRMAAQMIVGPWRDGLAKQFKEHSEHEITHAELVMRRIVALGGVIDTTLPPMPVWTNLDQILTDLVELEKEGVAAWRGLFDSLPPTDAFKHTIGEILSQEQDHWDEAERWKRNAVGAAQVKEDIDGNLAAPAENGIVPEIEPVADDETDNTDQEYSIVGDDRRLYVYGTNADYSSGAPIGEAWQDKQGVLYGSGICHMMLFESFANTMYSNSSIGLDTSPLSVFALRVSMSPFVRVSWETEGE